MTTNRDLRHLQLIASGMAMLIVPGAHREAIPLPHSAPLPAAVEPAATTAGADESWWQAVAGDLTRAEYAATTSSAGLQAPNRAQNLRTTFGERGIAVVPRTTKDAAPAWKFAWETSGFGRTGRMAVVPPAAPATNGARVTYRRDGWSEWYENTPKGLEQGFTIERRPEGMGQLQIAGKVPDGLEARPRADGAIDFIAEHGACAIRYGVVALDHRIEPQARATSARRQPRSRS